MEEEGAVEASPSADSEATASDFIVHQRGDGEEIGSKRSQSPNLEVRSGASALKKDTHERAYHRAQDFRPSSWRSPSPSDEGWIRGSRQEEPSSPEIGMPYLSSCLF